MRPPPPPDAIAPDAAAEPSPVAPYRPRLTRAPLPPYRYVPGRSPHPRRDPRGHGFGLPEPRAAAPDPARWAACEIYLRGVDLYNLAYFWEAHEAFEALWRASTGEQAAFFQGLIQVSAAELKRFMGADAAAQKIAARALGRLAETPARYMGVDVRRFAREVAARFRRERDAQVLLDVDDR